MVPLLPELRWPPSGLVGVVDHHQVPAASAPSLLQQAANASVAGKACKVGKVTAPMTRQNRRHHQRPHRDQRHRNPQLSWTEHAVTVVVPRHGEAGNNSAQWAELLGEDLAPSGDLDWRHGRADPENPANPNLGDDGGAQGMRVKQGTRLHIRTILGEMAKRSGRDALPTEPPPNDCVNTMKHFDIGWRGLRGAGNRNPPRIPHRWRGGGGGTAPYGSSSSHRRP